MAGRREDLEIVIGADLGGLAADLAKGARLAQQFGRDVDRAMPKTSDFKISIDLKGVRTAARELKEAAESSRTLAAQFRDVGRSVGGAGGWLVAFAGKAAIAAGAFVALETGLEGVGAAFRQVKESVAMAAEVEQNKIAFEAMLGSAQKAADLMAGLRKFAADTPFSAKEVIESGRQLTAYGIEAKDLISTLKVLGTVSAGTATPLKDNVLRYGTTRVQGRAMTQDLNQFTNAGINVYPGIAKALNIDISQVRKHTEMFGVEVNALNFALEDLARNQFAGLLEKQANSLRGSWEQLADAFDRAKVKLGEVVAEEVGLRTASRDLQGFAGELERGIGGERFRAGVRLVGELVKGGGQLAYEFGRAGVQIASINFDGFTRASPQVAQLARSVREVVSGLQDFKLDERAVAEFGIGVFEALVTPVAKATDFVQAEGKAYAEAFNKNFVAPMEKWVTRLQEVRDLVGRVWKSKEEMDMWAEKNGLNPEKFAEARRVRSDRDYLADQGIAAPLIPKGLFDHDDSMVKVGADIVRNAREFSFAPPMQGEVDKNIVFRYEHLRRLMDDARFLSDVSGFTQFKPFHEQFQKQHHEFLLPFSADPGRDLRAMEAQFKAGKVPTRRADWVPPQPPVAPKTNTETLNDRTAEFKRLFMQGFQERKMREGFQKLFESIDRAEAAGRMVGNPLSLMAALGPLGPVAGGIVAPGKDGIAAPGGSDLALPRDNRLPPHLVELAARTNEQYAP